MKRRSILKRIKNKFKSAPPPHPIIDFIDAPVMRGAEAYIPTGDTVAIAPNFHPARQGEPIAPVRLGEAEVSGTHGWIRQRKLWLMQFSWYGGQSFLPPSYQTPPQAPPPAEQTQEIAGEAASTIPCFDRVYGHILLDELPLLLFLLKDGRFRDFDAILCAPFARKLLLRLDHPDLPQMMERLIAADSATTYRCASLTALRRSGCRSNPSREEVDLLRGAAAPFARSDDWPRRIFLKRGAGSRAVTNMEDVSKTLKDHDITPVNAGEHPNPWALFANAELVVGVAGSDLSDSVFMSPGAALLEIHPSDHVKTYNWNVAQTLDLAYHSMIAPSEVLRGTLVGPGNSPIHISTDVLSKTLEEIGSIEHQ